MDLVYTFFVGCRVNTVGTDLTASGSCKFVCYAAGIRVVKLNAEEMTLWLSISDNIASYTYFKMEPNETQFDYVESRCL